jgi:hypothetical protein
MVEVEIGAGLVEQAHHPRPHDFLDPLGQGLVRRQQVASADGQEIMALVGHIADADLDGRLGAITQTA